MAVDRQRPCVHETSRVPARGITETRGENNIRPCPVRVKRIRQAESCAGLRTHVRAVAGGRQGQVARPPGMGGGGGRASCACGAPAPDRGRRMAARSACAERLGGSASVDLTIAQRRRLDHSDSNPPAVGVSNTSRPARVRSTHRPHTARTPARHSTRRPHTAPGGPAQGGADALTRLRQRPLLRRPLRADLREDPEHRRRRRRQVPARQRRGEHVAHRRAALEAADHDVVAHRDEREVGDQADADARRDEALDRVVVV